MQGNVLRKCSLVKNSFQEKGSNRDKEEEDESRSGIIISPSLVESVCDVFREMCVCAFGMSGYSSINVQIEEGVLSSCKKKKRTQFTTRLSRESSRLVRKESNCLRQ